MKIYRVTVEGQTYDVTVAEVAAVAPPPARRRVRPTSSSPAPAVAGTKEHRVLAPMPGKVVAVKVAPGDRVAAGTALVVLDAMKMENDVVSAVDGTIARVGVTAGTRVNNGDLLVVIA